MGLKTYRYDQQDSKYVVIEKPTNNIIFKTNSKDEAKAITNKLNGGQGFAGWTPEFFLRSVKS